MAPDKYAPYSLKEIEELENRAVIQSGPVLPLLTPLSAAITTLPPRPAQPPPFGPSQPDWICETFTLPAAYPRSYGATLPPGASPAPPPNPSTKVSLGPALHTLYTKALECLETPIDVNDPATFADQQQLHLSANCYRPAKGTKPVGSGLTLLFTHANGFHKEIWEPTITEMLDAWPDEAMHIEEIWSLDLINQGDSAILNESTLGETFNWTDNGRDVLQVLSSRLSSPSGRRVISIGHSVGGAAAVYAASQRPDLYSAVILVDPTVRSQGRSGTTRDLTSAALMRRGAWPNAETAREAFLAKPFFRSWDSRVLGKHLDFGLRDLADGTRALKALPKYEAVVFGEPKAVGSERIFTLLQDIPRTLPVHMIFAGTGQSVLSEDMVTRMVEEVPHSTLERVEDAGHLIAQTHPRDLGRRIAAYVAKNHGRGAKAKL